MPIQELDTRYIGLTHEPVGTVAVVRAIRTTGILWWKKTEYVWLVKNVRTEWRGCGGYSEVDDFWRTAGVFESRTDANILAAQLRQPAT